VPQQYCLSNDLRFCKVRLLWRLVFCIVNWFTIKPVVHSRSLLDISDWKTSLFIMFLSNVGSMQQHCQSQSQAARHWWRTLYTIITCSGELSSSDVHLYLRATLPAGMAAANVTRCDAANCHLMCDSTPHYSCSPVYSCDYARACLCVCARADWSRCVMPW
jgi:hypothetical protein